MNDNEKVFIKHSIKALNSVAAGAGVVFIVRVLFQRELKTAIIFGAIIAAATLVYQYNRKPLVEIKKP